MDGVLRCTRYAFGPNKLHYCGPDANSELLGYVNTNTVDLGLKALLKDFKTMFPYLRLIAEANKIKDVFDERVVEAYWLGNELLETIEKQKFYRHLIDEQGLKKRLGKSFSLITDKIGQGAVPHHSWHVFDVWRRTGHLDREHTLESMDSCRISWGEVIKVDGPIISVKTQPLVLLNGKLIVGKEVTKKITRQLESTFDIEQLKPGTLVSIHWNTPCEVITKKQAHKLDYYNAKHLGLANQTI